MGVSYQEAIDFIDGSNICKTNKDLIKAFFKWKYETQQKASPITLFKLATHFPTIDRWFKEKDWLKIDDKDCSVVLFNLRKNKFKRKDGKPFSPDTIESFVRDHRQILRWVWLNGKNKVCKNKTFDQMFKEYLFSRNENLEHIDIAEREPAIYSLDDVKKIVAKISKKRLDLAVIFAIGFDAGLRPQELFKVKINHLVWNENKKRYYIYVQYPKKSSERRNVDLYYFTDLIKDYLANNRDYKVWKSGNLEAGERDLFKIGSIHFARMIREYLTEFKLTKKKQFKSYDLRHSSIQHYLDIYKGDYKSMSLRYGWKFSKVGERLDGYLSRSTCTLPDALEQAHKDTITELKQEQQEQSKKYEDLFKKYEETIRLFKHLKR